MVLCSHESSEAWTDLFSSPCLSSQYDVQATLFFPPNRTLGIHQCQQTTDNSFLPRWPLLFVDCTGSSGGHCAPLCMSSPVSLPRHCSMRKTMEGAEQSQTTHHYPQGSLSLSGCIPECSPTHRRVCLCQGAAYTYHYPQGSLYPAGCRLHKGRKILSFFHSTFPFPFTQHFLLNIGWDKELPLGS